jgi:hypothetical protein
MLNFEPMMPGPTHAVLTRCPVCASATFVERVRCSTCDTAVEGRFSSSVEGFQSLTKEQRAFVKVFVSCRGKIKDVEQALGISYPTVVSRLEEVAEAIAAPAIEPPEPVAFRRKQILDDLASGVIDADEAAKSLRKAKG